VLKKRRKNGRKATKRTGETHPFWSILGIDPENLKETRRNIEMILQDMCHGTKNVEVQRGSKDQRGGALHAHSEYR